MQRFRIRPRREVGDGVELLEQLGNYHADVVSLTQLLKLSTDVHKPVFGLLNGALGIVFTLSFEALMVLDEFLAEKRGEALTRRSGQRPMELRGINAEQASLYSHSQVSIFSLGSTHRQCQFRPLSSQF